MGEYDEVVKKHLGPGPYKTGELRPGKALEGGDVRQTTEKPLTKLELTQGQLERIKDHMADGKSYEEAVSRVAGVPVEELEKGSYIIQRKHG